MISNWDRKFLELAVAVSKWSKDPNVKVGCVMADSDNNIICTGFNGLPRRIADTVERLEGRDLKLQMIIHAEANAVAVAGRSRLLDSTAYITRPPCSQCAGLLIQAGIYRAVWLEFDAPSKWKANCELAEDMLTEAGVIIDIK